MKTGVFVRTRWMRSTGFALALVPACLAENIRVTSWNLQLPAAALSPGVATQHIRQAAAALRALDPDVILLWQVRDWKICAQLAQALKPVDYTVALCSSFRDARTGAPSHEQVAILSKQKAYFSWSEAWHPDGTAALTGGLAFAAIQFKNQRIGFFSVQLDNQLSPLRGPDGDAAALRARDFSARQWSLAVESFKKWVTNRIGAAVVAGGFGAPAGWSRSVEKEPALAAQEEAFIDSFLGAPLDQPVTLPAQGEDSDASADYVRARLVSNPDTLPAVILNRSASTCDLEIIPHALANPTAFAEDSRDQHPDKPEVSTLPARANDGRSQGMLPTIGASRSDGKDAGPNLQTPASVPSPAASSLASHTPAGPWFWWVATLPGFMAFIVLAWVLTRRKPARWPGRPALLPANAETTTGATASYTVVVTPAASSSAIVDSAASPEGAPAIQLEPLARTQTQSKAWPGRTSMESQPREASLKNPWLVLHLSQWLKQKLVQKLLFDRAELMQSQQAATLKMLKVDERLARIELQIQQQNRAYERRIEGLNQELLAAKEENRELIRARITQVKAEMEAARARIIAEAESQQTS